MRMTRQNKTFEFKPFSSKQKKILTWWMDESPVCDMDGIIADGAIRSGKTLAMSLSFVIWAMTSFNDQTFAVCGKTIGSFRRNVLPGLKSMLPALGYNLDDRRSDNLVVIRRGETENYFYIFGGKDEKSQDLIQGLTLAGVLFDEVALMPESFINQATGRCSVTGSKFWFNCNPGSPYHWFNEKWLQRADDKNLVHLHFLMNDNLSLDEKIKRRYEMQYTGVFYKRFICGLWAAADGVVYDMFDPEIHTIPRYKLPAFSKLYVGVDYGSYNPTAYILAGLGTDGKWYVIKEYVWNPAEKGRQKTVNELSKDMEEFIRGLPIKAIYIDPSAAALILQLRRDGVKNVRKAKNDVIPGIQMVGTLFNTEKLYICDECIYLIKSLSNYIWDDKAIEHGEDKVVKKNDHEADALRYVIYSAHRGAVKPMKRI